MKAFRQLIAKQLDPPAVESVTAFSFPTPEITRFFLDGFNGFTEPDWYGKDEALRAAFGMGRMVRGGEWPMAYFATENAPVKVWVVRYKLDPTGLDRLRATAGRAYRGIVGVDLAGFGFSAIGYYVKDGQVYIVDEEGEAMLLVPDHMAVGVADVLLQKAIDSANPPSDPKECADFLEYATGLAGADFERAELVASKSGFRQWFNEKYGHDFGGVGDESYDAAYEDVRDGLFLHGLSYEDAYAATFPED